MKAKCANCEKNIYTHTKNNSGYYYYKFLNRKTEISDGLIQHLGYKYWSIPFCNRCWDKLDENIKNKIFKQKEIYCLQIKKSLEVLDFMKSKAPKEMKFNIKLLEEIVK
jgi:hypothetical protein